MESIQEAWLKIKASTERRLGDWGIALLVLIIAVACFGLGGFILFMTIKALNAPEEPDITINTGQRLGRSGLLVFLVLGVIIVIVGIALIVALAKGGK